MSRIENHKEKNRDCVKIYLDMLLWQIKARKQRALWRRGLNSFHSMKKWGWSGMWGKGFQYQARVWERECLIPPQGGSSIPRGRVSGTLGWEVFLPMIASPKPLDGNIKTQIVPTDIAAECNNPKEGNKARWNELNQADGPSCYNHTVVELARVKTL